MMNKARKCFRKQKGLVRWNTPNYRKQPRNTPNHFIYLPFHTKPLILIYFPLSITLIIYYLKWNGYQRRLITKYNEHPYSLIWVFAADKRKGNMGGSGLLQMQKKKKKNLNKI